ncbi:MAG: 4Fe-4S ferredoxin [Actinobacteria bacterium RBG_16_64_13]|nr:MAG: 4Fe-4S ferredoxin [Actinobacteria bacterium RBG_16_64_13]
MSEFQGCPGSRMMDLRHNDEAREDVTGAPVGAVASELRQWPIQLHLVSPQAPYFQGADVLLAADCTAYAVGGFHKDYLKGKSLAIACPKLDEGQDIYLEKLKTLIDEGRINTLTVLTMQVPCCRGLVNLATRAVSDSGRKVPLKSVVVDLQGEVLSEEWL